MFFRYNCQAQGQGQGQRQTSKLDPEVGVVIGEVQNLLIKVR